MSRLIVLDIETAAHPNAGSWFDPVEPDSRLVDPAKIAKSIAEKTTERDEKLSLDPDACRLVALGFHAVGYGDPTCYLMSNEMEERLHLQMFWEMIPIN